MTETWRQHPVYADHEASSLGRIRRKSIVRYHWNGRSVIERMFPEQLITAVVTKRDGYRVFSVRYEGLPRVQLRASAFILECFVGERPGLDFHACHNDGNRSNDKLENLRWDTASGNMRDRIKHGTQNRMFGERNPLTTLTTSDVHKIRAASGTLREIAELFGISEAQVSRIRRFKSRAAAA